MDTDTILEQICDEVERLLTAKRDVQEGRLLRAEDHYRRVQGNLKKALARAILIPQRDLIVYLES